MSNIVKYNKVFEEIFEIAEKELNENFTVKNIDEWDSLVHITLVSELENTFDVLLDPEDIISFDSYLKGIEILRKCGVEI